MIIINRHKFRYYGQLFLFKRRNNDDIVCSVNARDFEYCSQTTKLKRNYDDAIDNIVINRMSYFCNTFLNPH
jgi:hypothetical protein